MSIRQTNTPAVLERRLDVLVDLLEHLDLETTVPFMDEDRDVPGCDPTGRFVVVAVHESDGPSFTRTNGRARAEQVAGDYVRRGFTDLELYDLDKLPPPRPLQVQDDVLNANGVWVEVDEVQEEGDRRRLLLADGSWMYEDETDEDGGIDRFDYHPVPLRYALAGVTVAVHFDTVPS